MTTLELAMVNGSVQADNGYSWQYVGKDGGSTIFHLFSPVGTEMGWGK